MILRILCCAVLQFCIIGYVFGVMPTITRLNVQCDRTGMKVNVEFDNAFNGIVFSKGHYSDPSCRWVTASSSRRMFNFYISNNKCGTIGTDMARGSTSPQGFKNVIIIQNDPDYQDVWDSARKLSCDWVTRLEKYVTFAPFGVDMLGVKELRFPGDAVDCWMDIQRGHGPFAPSVGGVVPIGEKLTVVIYVRDTDSSFDVHVKDCYAYDTADYRNPEARAIKLTDEKGCAVKEKLVQGFYRTRDVRTSGATIIAYGIINAFKFPERMDVFLACNVEVCKGSCPENSCQPEVAVAGEGEPGGMIGGGGGSSGAGGDMSSTTTAAPGGDGGDEGDGGDDDDKDKEQEKDKDKEDEGATTSSSTTEAPEEGGDDEEKETSGGGTATEETESSEDTTSEKPKTEEKDEEGEDKEEMTSTKDEDKEEDKEEEKKDEDKEEEKKDDEDKEEEKKDDEADKEEEKKDEEEKPEEKKEDGEEKKEEGKKEDKDEEDEEEERRKKAARIRLNKKNARKSKSSSGSSSSGRKLSAVIEPRKRSVKRPSRKNVTTPKPKAASLKKRGSEKELKKGTTKKPKKVKSSKSSGKSSNLASASNKRVRIVRAPSSIPAAFSRQVRELNSNGGSTLGATLLYQREGRHVRSRRSVAIAPEAENATFPAMMHSISIISPVEDFDEQELTAWEKMMTIEGKSEEVEAKMGFLEAMATSVSRMPITGKNGEGYCFTMTSLLSSSILLAAVVMVLSMSAAMTCLHLRTRPEMGAKEANLY